MVAVAVASKTAARESGALGGSRAAREGSVCRERMLFLRWQRERDGAAREELVERFSSLSRRLARRYRHTSEPVEDLYQVAQLGLIKAIDGFDADRGFTFAAYAIPTILGELRRYFRSASWAVHVPRSAQERALEFRDAERMLADEHGRSPTVPELAQFMERSIEEVLEAMQTLRALGWVSLDAPRGRHTDDEQDSYLDTIGAEDPRYELVELDTDLTAALRLLEPRQREILRLRFIEGLSQSQIAERIGVSQMQISRLLARCLAKLRNLTEDSAERPVS
jgi:RNA polymerase sigma-B factor